MAPKDLKTMLLLDANPAGMFGSQIVAQSDGFVGRGTIYTLLSRLIDKGWVSAAEVPASDVLQLARARYFITTEGRRELRAFLKLMGLQRQARGA